MAAGRIIVLVAALSAHLLTGECCISTPTDPPVDSNPSCCSGHSGGTSAPWRWPDIQSPAGGPSANGGAAVCYFYRSSNCLICSIGSSESQCCTQPPDETDDTAYGGPTPYNEYLIGRRYTHPGHGIDWYNLYPRMETVFGYYGYNQPTATGRYAMGLHPGSVSLGCVTVTDDSCWDETRSIVSSGYMTYKGSTYSGFLYVL